MKNRLVRTLLSLSALMLISATASSQNSSQIGHQVAPPNERLHSHTQGDVRVTTAVPSAAETRTIFAADLYSKNIQPVWVQIENRGDKPLFLAPMGLDPGYYTARETAHRSQGSGADNSLLNHDYEQAGLSRMHAPAHSIRSGYVFSRVDEGTKSFNIDVIGSGVAYTMSFFIPVPGLRLDHYEVDINNLYPPSELKELALPELVRALETLPCCVSDEAGESLGDPLNLVFVGDLNDMYYAFMRAGWDETETIYGSSLLKTFASAITGGKYRYSPVSALYVFDRPQDAAMQRARNSIHERNHLRVWLTPFQHQGKSVWIGQISRDIGVHFTWKTITTHKIDPDVDETREFLVEDLAYSQALQKFGYVGGVGRASYDQPRGNLTGDPYFTDGRRVVMWISGQPTSLGALQLMDLDQYGEAASSSTKPASVSE